MLLTYTQAIVLGVLQGVTELFPISSLGHSLIIPYLLGWDISSNANFYLIFLVATHLATSIVLFFFYLKDWKLIIGGVFRSLRDREVREDDTYAKLGWLIVIATVPAGILGLLFEQKLQLLFSFPQYVASFLILNGFLLYGTEKLKKNAARNGVIETGVPQSSRDEKENDSQSDVRIARTSWRQSIKIGFAQSLALLPGFSRTGAAMAGGILSGLDHEDSARFSFLLATPIIFAAAVLKLPELLVGNATVLVMPVLVGFIASAIGAFFSVKFLTRYFKTNTLNPFALYCILAGLLTLVVFFLR